VLTDLTIEGDVLLARMKRLVILGWMGNDDLKEGN